MKTGAGLITLFRFAPVVFVLAHLFVSPATPSDSGERWLPVGPLGGDVRSLALDPTDPRRVYLGTATGVLYRSDTAGRTWRRLTPGFPRAGQSLDAMAVSPRGTLLVAFWDVSGRGGGVAKSDDHGESFRITLDAESVRALSLAPSSPNLVFAGSLGGVFASADSGESWRRITPLDHPELRNVESVAVDPRDPRRLYIGTRHLPWKTMNGGLTWVEVHRGMIEDSDVFTITLDRRDPDRVHATACSGIYGSRNAARRWSRVRGLPYGSRRTRAFAQDAQSPDIFYAGTTEGLWVSMDDTATWTATTPLDLVVNDVVSLRDGTVLAGTDGAGVLRSADHGRTWSPSNDGFSERFVSKIAFDPVSLRYFAGILGDRLHGGVFSATEAIGPWTSLGGGLKGREVLTLAVSGTQTLAGTDRGLYVLETGEAAWRPQALAVAGTPVTPRVADLASARGTSLAATPLGVFRSVGCCEPWGHHLAADGEATAVAISSDGQLALAATRAGLRISRDTGLTWAAVEGKAFGRVNALAIVPGRPAVMIAATHRGVRVSADEGRTWSMGARGLPDSDYTSLAATEDGGAIFVSDFSWGGIFRSEDRGASWTRLTGEGLATDRVWTLGIGPPPSTRLLAAPAAGGLHVR